MTDRNRDLVAFDIVRAGDDVTLAFALRRGGSRADFRLLGNKHDYYRMAMGVRLDETFKIIAQADPNVEPLEVVKNDGDLVLRLSYKWPPGTEPAEAAAPARQPPPPEPVAAAPAPAGDQAPTRSPRRDRGRIQPPPEEEPERNPKYFVPARPLEGGVVEAAREVTPSPPPGAATRVAQPPPPAALPEPPPGTEGEVAVPAPQESAPLDAAPRVKEVGDLAQAEPAAPPPSDELSPEDRSFTEAYEEGSIAAWTRFLEQHPEAPQASEARKRLEALQAEAEFEAAKGRDDPEAYRAYLGRFPASLRAGEAEARLRALELRRERTVAEDQARGEADRRRREAYDEARRLDNVTAYRVFLAAYPDAPEAAELRRYLEAAEADDEAFAQASGSTQGLEAYLATRPKGRHADDARRRLTALRNAASDGAYREAEARGTAEAMEAFLKAWPKSPRSAEARVALESLRKAAKADAAGGAGLPETTLVAPFVATAPILNGRSNDPAWQGAPVAEVPLTGSRTLRLRAAHDGRNVYLLAQWGDGSRDAQYRPWLWDAAKKTYRQSTHVDDALAVALYRGRPPAEACMLQGQNQEADFWMWRAFWSELSGLADDQTFRVSRERTPKSNSYANQGGTGQVWIREDADAGSPGWSFFIPVDYQATSVPSYKRAEAAGSRGDVRAASLWDGGAWTVEFARALDTRHGDDLALKVGNAYAISFAVYDKSEKGRHATSGLVRLELRGR